MGVRDCFDHCYGVDLINTFKNSSEYYTHPLVAVGIAPAAAWVVDDSPQALAWAASVGAQTVLVVPYLEASCVPTMPTLRTHERCCTVRRSQISLHCSHASSVQDDVTVEGTSGNVR
jgi:FMN phosphatase YigB (HAD superfamily)